MDHVADPVETSDYVSVFDLGSPAIAQLLALRSPYRPYPVVQRDDPVECLEEGQIGLDWIVWPGGGAFQSPDCMPQPSSLDGDRDDFILVGLSSRA